MSWLQNTFRGLLFKNVAFNLTIQVQKNMPLTNEIKISFMNEEKILKNHFVVQDKLSSQLFINLFLKEEDYILKDKILSNSFLLKDVLIIKNGVKPYEKGKGKPAQTSETLKEKPYTSEIKKDETFSPLIGGSLFNKYKLLWDNNYWIKYGEWLAAPREKEIFESSEKLIFRQTSDSLIGTYIGAGFIMRNNTHILLAKENSVLKLKYVLAVLNSKLLDYFYWTINPEKGEAMAEVKAFHLGLLPIKNISLEAQQPFITLADKMLTLNETLQKKSGNFIKVVKQTFALEKISTKLETFYNLDFDGFMKELKQKLTPKTKLEWLEVFEDTKKSLQEIQTQIAATDKEINTLVYKLYDLTDEEIKIVEGR